MMVPPNPAALAASSPALPAADPEITKLLMAWGRGDDSAQERLLSLVSDELRRLARHYMSRERRNHTLQTSALVNEAYLRLIDARQVSWQSRAHFFALSANLMRRILVDYARRRRYQKRGGGAQPITLDEAMITPNAKGRDLLALDDCLTALAQLDERKARVIELRFFAGLSVEESAEALGVSADTVMRDWRLAKRWLAREMSRGSQAGADPGLPAGRPARGVSPPQAGKSS